VKAYYLQTAFRLAQLLPLFIGATIHDRTNAADLLVVTITTDKPVYLIGEPVGLTATIRYNGSTPVHVNNPLDPGPYQEIVEIALPGDTRFERFVTRIEHSDAKRDRATLLPPVRFEPGTNLVREHVVQRWYRGFAAKYNTNLLVFPTKGDYRIRFTAVFDKRVFSEERIISVVDPITDVDKAAWTWLSQSNRLERFCDLDYLPKPDDYNGPQEFRERMLKPFDEFLAKYRESAYARYISRIAPERAVR